MPNRTLCDVLSEMRKCTETLNFSYLSSLIEEAQYMGNRMEASLYDKYDYNRLKKDIKELKEQKKKLTEELGKGKNETDI